MAEKKTWYKIEEVALLVGSSALTVNMWYRFKRENPNHPMAKLLPKYKLGKVGTANTRCWSEDDIERILEFKSNIKSGRNGFMGAVTQRYTKKGKVNETDREVNRINYRAKKYRSTVTE